MKDENNKKIFIIGKLNKKRSERLQEWNFYVFYRLWNTISTTGLIFECFIPS